jgi:MFS family permease
MALNRDGKFLLITRVIRLFSYGMLAVVLVFYLTDLGLTEPETGLLLTLTLAGDTAVSLALTTHADRLGRRRTLIAGAILMAGAGLAFALTRNFLLLVVAGTIGVISPSGNEVGPFLSVEQAALSEVIPSRERSSFFAWYTLTGSIAMSCSNRPALRRISPASYIRPIQRESPPDIAPAASPSASHRCLLETVSRL